MMNDGYCRYDEVKERGFKDEQKPGYLSAVRVHGESAFTVRMKACLDAPIDVNILMKAAQEAIGRFPYFRDKFCITFQLINKDRRLLELFCEVLDQEKIPYSVSERHTRYMTKIKLP